MGPLVPFILSNEFGLIVAILVGIAFGFTLEQAGFSSTKKLVGLFYGYDFTVLRVFFTAGVTAMIGVLLLSHYGLLDMKVIYINPTFVRSALIGGAIMGAGFVIGGFCPGTSVCAAAIGKIDAMMFIIGSILGVFLFVEVYPAIKKFYMADNLGNVTIYEQLGMSRNMFAFLLTFIALFAFYVTWRIENKVNGRAHSLNKTTYRRYAAAMALPVVILLMINILPGKQEIIQNRITKAKEQRKCVFHEISADKLAYEITHNFYQINIIDVRTPEEYEKFHIPMAINIPFNDILNREWETIFKQKMKTNIFYANNDTTVRMACLKAKYVGNSENQILRESAEEFEQMFFEITPPDPDSPKEVLEVYHFRTIAASKMNDLLESLQNIGKPVKKEIRRVQGGCS